MKFGAYEILHELKSGGMGAVLLGRRKGPGSFEQLVAIKTIRPEYASTETVRAMFLDEAKIVGGINHPGIATVHDFGEEAGSLYMAMEYVAGLSFRSVMELGAIPPAIAARAIAEACRGLHAAHEVRDPSGHVQGVVHRDISPDNLLLGFDGHVKVIDFGIALVKNRQSPVTEFGIVKGKPPYMSPEQVKNEALDRRSDVFSLGVVLHEMLTGEMLFDGDSIYAIARKVENLEILPPSKVLGRPLPVGLDAVVMAALERDPAKRTPTAAAFAEQLEQVVSGDETLEAWAERSLAESRDAHRAWLAEVVAGRDLPRPIGRPTGSVTALGPIALVDQLAKTPVAPAPIIDEPIEVPPRRKLGLPIAALLLLALAVTAVIVLTRTPKRVAIADAAVDSTPDTAVVAQHADAAEIVEPPPDVLAVVDAAVVVVVVRDAGPKRPPPDTAPKPDAPVAAPDAAVVAQGNGKLIVKHHPTSKTHLQVLVDGKAAGQTPTLPYLTLPAGPHTITLLSPIGGAVVYTTNIVIVDGKTETVVQPAP